MVSAYDRLPYHRNLGGVQIPFHVDCALSVARCSPRMRTHVKMSEQHMGLFNTVSGVSKLCKALEGNTSLWSLPLEGNEAGRVVFDLPPKACVKVPSTPRKASRLDTQAQKP